MKTTIQSLHFTPQERLNDFLTEKLNELELSNPMIIDGQVCLKINKSEKVDNKICEIIIRISDSKLIAEKHCATFEEAIEQAVKELEDQLNNYKN